MISVRNSSLPKKKICAYCGNFLRLNINQMRNYDKMLRVHQPFITITRKTTKTIHELFVNSRLTQK